MWHSAVQVGEKSYIWGGRTQDFLHGGKDRLKSTVNVFDPYLETWQEKHTSGSPPHGLYGGAYTANTHSLYSFAVHDRKSRCNSLHVLDTSTLVWKDITTSNATSSPMSKSGCGMVFFGKNHLATIGGYGLPSQPIQPGSSFIKDPDYMDGMGWTDEFHIFDVKDKSWLIWVIGSLVPRPRPPIVTFCTTSSGSWAAQGLGTRPDDWLALENLYVNDMPR